MLNNLRPELLALSKENCDYLRTAKIKPEDLHSHNFSGTDFEFFLTDKENDSKEYNLCAFYTQEETGRGKEMLSSWNEFMAKVDGIIMPSGN